MWDMMSGVRILLVMFVTLQINYSLKFEGRFSIALLLLESSLEY